MPELQGVSASPMTKAITSWNADVRGLTGRGWDIPWLRATNFQSDKPWLNTLLRGVNNTTGLAAGLVNYVNNVAGALFFELPARAEDFSVRHGGPDFAELAIISQSATPGVPLDELFFKGLKEISSFSKKITLVKNGSVTWKGGDFLPQELEKHFRKHFHEWGNLFSEEIYLKNAKNLLKQVPNKIILGHVRKNGDILRYNLLTNELAVSRSDGTIRTFFRPKEGIRYWLNELSR